MPCSFLNAIPQMSTWLAFLFFSKSLFKGHLLGEATFLYSISNNSMTLLFPCSWSSSHCSSSPEPSHNPTYYVHCLYPTPAPQWTTSSMRLDFFFFVASENSSNCQKSCLVHECSVSAGQMPAPFVLSSILPPFPQSLGLCSTRSRRPSVTPAPLPGCGSFVRFCHRCRA